MHQIDIAPRLRRIAAAVCILGVGLILGPIPAQAADRSVDPSTLTPAPPDFFNATCDRAGSNIRCGLSFTDPESPVQEPTGIVCGSGPDRFEVLDTWTRFVVGTRVYSSDGLLLQRHFKDHFEGHFTNSVTGATADYVQATTYLHDLAVPGDVATGDERQSTHLRLVTAHGSTVLESGHLVLRHEDDAVVFASGIHAFEAYFDSGGSTALQALCDALS
jgi:hypothetical protein